MPAIERVLFAIIGVLLLTACVVLSAHDRGLARALKSESAAGVWPCVAR